MLTALKPRLYLAVTESCWALKKTVRSFLANFTCYRLYTSAAQKMKQVCTHLTA